MKTGEFRTKLAIPFGVIFVITLCLSSLQAGIQSGQVFVQAVSGPVEYSLDDISWKPLAVKSQVPSGASIKTLAGATADISLNYNGSVFRLTPNTTLKLEKLSTQTAGEETITETKLNLLEGSLVGSQRKLAKPSVLEIATAHGTATIRGTEYVVNADGAVSVISGVVTVNYNLPGNGGDIKVTILAGQTFDPALGTVVPTTAAYLQNLIADITTVKKNAEVFKAGGATIVVKPDGNTLSPSKPKGNNGVGNGIDPQPPGNPPINDGPGTGPGNPGNKGGHKP